MHKNKPVFTLNQIAFAPAGKSYPIGLLFTRVSVKRAVGVGAGVYSRVYYIFLKECCFRVRVRVNVRIRVRVETYPTLALTLTRHRVLLTSSSHTKTVVAA